MGCACFKGNFCVRNLREIYELVNSEIWGGDSWLLVQRVRVVCVKRVLMFRLSLKLYLRFFVFLCSQMCRAYSENWYRKLFLFSFNPPAGNCSKRNLMSDFPCHSLFRFNNFSVTRSLEGICKLCHSFPVAFRVREFKVLEALKLARNVTRKTFWNFDVGVTKTFSKSHTIFMKNFSDQKAILILQNFCRPKALLLFWPATFSAVTMRTTSFWWRFMVFLIETKFLSTGKSTHILEVYVLKSEKFLAGGVPVLN